MKNTKQKQNIVIIGAGPAGLGCAYELTEKNNKSISITMLDKNDKVGGLARTYQKKGHYFDVGPHRFFTKNEEVLNFWKQILGPDFIEVNRLTRILYNKKLFYYPVQLKDVLTKLGLLTSTNAMLSFIYAKIFLRSLEPKTFEEWITQNFGQKLYQIFFKTYTEKVWGIPCDQIGAEWAAQRIKNLNFFEVVKTAILGQKSRKAKSLVDKFYYPRKGAGEMFQKIAEIVQKKDTSVLLNQKITRINHSDNKIQSVDVETSDNKSKNYSTNFLFSSMPLTDFILSLSPKPPKDIIEAAHKLYFRDHITVNLLVKNENLFPDNWIYVHDPKVEMARITNYNNFLEDRGINNKEAGIAVEYFVFQKDEIWQKEDSALIAQAVDELVTVGLISKDQVFEGFVIRETESYPTYYMGHKPYFDLLKDYVAQFSNLQLIGRGGMYKYDNMDHAIYSGMLAARNFNAGKKIYNVWAINEDAEYLEEQKQ